MKSTHKQVFFFYIPPSHNQKQNFSPLKSETDHFCMTKKKKEKSHVQLTVKCTKEPEVFFMWFLRLGTLSS